MFKRTLFIAVMVLGSAAGTVVADGAADGEPVLRLRFQDPLPVATLIPELRPRFDAGVATQSAAMPMPRVTLQDGGPVGKFAYISTAHPNVVIALGATEDRSAIGRQIDRAVTGMARPSPLFDKAQDTSPFIGMGLRTGAVQRGWSMDASIGAGLILRADNARVAAAFETRQQADFDAEARANLRLRYSF